MSIRRITVDSQGSTIRGFKWTLEKAEYPGWRGDTRRSDEFLVVSQGFELTEDDAWREAIRQQEVTAHFGETSMIPLENSYGESPINTHQHVYCDRSGVYFVQGEGGGPIKIGWASNVSSRLSALQIGSPVKLKVLAIVQTDDASEERKLHKKFNALRLHGEWFVDSPGLLMYVQALLDRRSAKEANAIDEAA